MKRRKTEDGGKHRSSLLLPAVVLSVGLAGAGILLGARGSSPAEAAETPDPAPEQEVAEGTIAAVEPVTLNLGDGHSLKVGMALQFAAMEEDGHHEERAEETTAKASDIAIDLLSKHSMGELSDPTMRTAIKEELVARVRHAYRNEVVDVYLTEFAMQ